MQDIIKNHEQATSLCARVLSVRAVMLSSQCASAHRGNPSIQISLARTSQREKARRSTPGRFYQPDSLIGCSARLPITESRDKLCDQIRARPRAESSFASTFYLVMLLLSVLSSSFSEKCVITGEMEPT